MPTIRHLYMPSRLVLGTGRNEIGIELPLLLSQNVGMGMLRILGERRRRYLRNREYRILDRFEVVLRVILAFDNSQVLDHG